MKILNTYSLLNNEYWQVKENFEYRNIHSNETDTHRKCWIVIIILKYSVKIMTQTMFGCIIAAITKV